MLSARTELRQKPFYSEPGYFMRGNWETCQMWQNQTIILLRAVKF
jgi:hypothetical protein